MFLPKFHFFIRSTYGFVEVFEGWVHRKKSQLGHHPDFSFLLITNPILVLDHVNWDQAFTCSYLILPNFEMKFEWWLIYTFLIA